MLSMYYFVFELIYIIRINHIDPVEEPLVVLVWKPCLYCSAYRLSCGVLGVIVVQTTVRHVS